MVHVHLHYQVIGFTFIHLQLGDDTFGHSTIQNFKDNGVDVCLIVKS